MKEKVRGVEKDAQVSGLQTWAERVPLKEVGGDRATFGHDHVEFEVPEPGQNLLSGHWFIEFWSLKNIGGAD